MDYHSHSVDNKKSVDVGLKILLQKLSQGKGDPNKVLIMCGSKFTKVKPIFHMNHNTKSSASLTSENNSCFLKYCFLCNKTLRLDKEVYMYKGDQGFCSVECRNRQIYLDEIKEIEKCTKKILGSFRRRGDSGRCSETMALLEDYQQRRKPLSYSKNQPIIFTLS